MTANTNAAPGLRDQIMDVITGVWDRETQIGDAADTVIDLCALSVATQPPAGRVMIPRELVERVQETLAEFLRQPERVPMSHKQALKLAQKAGMVLSPAQFSGVLETETDEYTLVKFAEMFAEAAHDIQPAHKGQA